MSHKPFDPSISWPENVHYFGEPSPEIDENWEKLIEFRYFSISEEEAKGVWGDDYHEYVDQLQGGYTAGWVDLSPTTVAMLTNNSLDVFHTLHCVVCAWDPFTYITTVGRYTNCAAQNAVRKALRPDYYEHDAPNEIPHVGKSPQLPKLWLIINWLIFRSLPRRNSPICAVRWNYNSNTYQVLRGNQT